MQVQADTLNIRRGHFNNGVALGGGALTGYLSGLVTAGSTAGTIGTATGFAISTYLTQYSPSLNVGDTLTYGYDICSADTDFGAVIQNQTFTVTPGG